MVILDLRAGPLRLWYADHDVLCCKLQKIPVTGDHRNIQTFLFHPLCQLNLFICGKQRDLADLF